MNERWPRGLFGWARGAVLALMALALAGVSARDALVQALARTRPMLALRLDPNNGVALDAAFQQTMAAAAATRMDRWARRARSALHDTPLSAAMVRIASADPTLSRPRQARLLDIAESISRRDSLTQLALIEIAVAAGRVKLALVHYDRALSIYPDLRGLLLPVLTGALAQPEVRQSIMGLARQRRPWIEAFVAFAVEQRAAAGNVAALLAGLDEGPAAWPLARGYEAVLSGRLAATGDYAAARRLAMRATGQDSAFIDRLDFVPATWASSVRPLTWAPGEAQGVSAELGVDRIVVVTAGSGSSGQALTRVMMVAPGRYKLAATVAELQETASARGRWTLICLGGKGQGLSALAELAVDPTARATAGTLVTVPVGCNALRIDFTIDNADGSADAGLVLRNVMLSPVH